MVIDMEIKPMNNKRLWKLTGEKTGFVMYSSVKPVAGEVAKAANMYYSDGKQPETGQALDMYTQDIFRSATRSAVEVTDNPPEWFKHHNVNEY